MKPILDRVYELIFEIIGITMDQRSGKSAVREDLDIGRGMTKRGDNREAEFSETELNHFASHQ